ncbi:hypothetical protein [Rhodoferax sp.]|uniref:hypothetical protein n=1 Tax=Rhodoferax sp. TaxID=50421 RepID=UPI0025CC80F7|nr:hypothetical protein [Rhodoferax sp.]
MGENGPNMHGYNTTGKASSTYFRLMGLVLALLLLLSVFNVAAGTLLAGKVIGVLDGDTIDVLDVSKTSHRIRLIWIK